MKQKSFRAGANSINDILVGVIVSVAVLLIGISVFATLIIQEMIGELHIGYCAVAILLLSSMSGAMVIRRRKTGIQIQMYLIASIIFYLLLTAVTVIFFKGKFQGIFVTYIVVFSGCLLPVVLRGKKKSKRKAVRNKIHHG